MKQILIISLFFLSSFLFSEDIVSKLTAQLEESNEMIITLSDTIKDNNVLIKNLNNIIKDNNDTIDGLNDRIIKDEEEIKRLRDEADDSLSELNKIKQYQISTLIGLDTFNKAYYIDLNFGMNIPIIPFKIISGISISSNMDMVLKAGLSFDF